MAVIHILRIGKSVSFEIEEFFFFSLLFFSLKYQNSIFPGAMWLFDNTQAALVVFNEHYRQLLSCKILFYFFILGGNGELLVRSALRMSLSQSLMYS